MTNGKMEESYSVETGQGSPSSPCRQDMYCSSTMPGDGPLTSPEGTGSKDDDSPKRLCLVCGDIASGFHYGVASCEACKAFFKRTIQGNIEYTCPAANDCEINKRRRKACQACRFQKCLRMGMLKEGVRLDRVRGGRQKYRRNPDTPFQIQMVTSKKPSLEDNKLLNVLTSCEPEPLLATLDPNVPESEYKIVGILSDLVDRELVGAIGWAKQIPGFTDLSLNDQMHSLQSSWAEILALSLAYRSLPLSGRLYYTIDFVMDEKQARLCHAEDLFSHCIAVVDRLERINIYKEEYLILKALLLTNTDVHMDDASALKKLRETLLAGLIDVVSVLRPSNPQLHFGNLLLCLPILRQVDTIVRHYWSTIRQEGKVPMNKLFVEMLESHLR